MLHGFKMLRGATYESGVPALSTARRPCTTRIMCGRPSCASYAWRKPYLRREWPETEAAPTKGVDQPPCSYTLCSVNASR